MSSNHYAASILLQNLDRIGHAQINWWPLTQRDKNRIKKYNKKPRVGKIKRTKIGNDDAPAAMHSICSLMIVYDIQRGSNKKMNDN